jgi:hypothetical protein
VKYRKADGSGRVGTWLGMVLVFSHYLIEKEAFHAIVGAVTASAITACSPVSFEPTTSSALVICWPHPNARPLRRTVRPRTVTPKDLRLGAAAPVVAAG